MNKTGFSLASVFFLTIVVAIFASGVQMAVSGPDPIESDGLVGLGCCGFCIGMLVGGFVGSRSDNSKLGTGLGVLAGAVFGPPSMILAVTGAAVPVVVIGSGVLFIFVWIVRKLSSSPSEERRSSRS